MLTLQRPDVYVHIARFYDLVTAPFLASARERLAGLCRAHNFTRVLDVGCGTGRLLMVLREHQLRAMGVDCSPAMLDCARNCSSQPFSLVCSGALLPFAAQSFDVAIVSLVLHETEDDPVALLHEIMRVAGHALVLEWKMPERNLDYAGFMVTRCIERLAGRGHYRQFCRFRQRGGLRGLVYDAGLHIVSEEIRAGGMLGITLVKGER